jgi:hypothetical protein
MVIRQQLRERADIIRPRFESQLVLVPSRYLSAQPARAKSTSGGQPDVYV